MSKLPNFTDIVHRADNYFFPWQRDQYILAPFAPIEQPHAHINNICNRDSGFSITVKEATIPHPDGPHRYRKNIKPNKNISCAFYAFHRSELDEKDILVKHGMGGVNVLTPAIPEIEFSFWNPSRPDVMAIIQRCCNGDVTFQNFVPFDLLVAPVNHSTFYFDLKQKLTNLWLQQGMTLEDDGILIKSLYNDVRWN